MLQFDAQTTEILETAYAGADFTKRRRASFDILNPQPVERIVDIGCGNGTLMAELARSVGPEGKVVGVDQSVEMLDAAKARTEGMGQVAFEIGSASALPLEDGSFDNAVSLQVFEYISDIDVALSEVARVLKPGGRFVIADIHFDSWIWHSDDPERMSKMKEAWGHHAAHWDLPQHLPRHLSDAGFEVEQVVPHTTVDHTKRPDGYGAIMIPLMSGYARQNGLVEAAEIDAWVAEQDTLSKEGRFFFSLTQIIISARMPG